jgi:hypothetical protein
MAALAPREAASLNGGNTHLRRRPRLAVRHLGYSGFYAKLNAIMYNVCLDVRFAFYAMCICVERI